ncbi:MAG: ATP-binding protein [Candidatus Aminicenantes bacterium]|nr:MAG: ATP-binding protein [Candidatus Aminicenantes bacterium]
MTGLKRNLEDKLNKLLTFFPAVTILGVRQGGKTTLAKMIRPQWKYFDLEKGSDYDRMTNDVDFFFRENPEHLIIDEIQQAPQLFQELRGIIDRDREKKGRFILTGSSSFELVKNISDSLAGRVGIVELGTLKLNEFAAKPLSPFYKIFDNPLSLNTLEFLKDLQPQVSHEQVTNFFLKGGYPEPAVINDDEFHFSWMENYYKTYIERDIRKLFPKLDIVKYRRFIAMLSSLSGTIINRSEVGRSLDTSEVTVKEYLDIAHGTYVWRNIPSYEKSVIKSILKMPKGILRDSGLSHFLQRIRDKEQLNAYPRVGNSFEAFITGEIIKGLEAKMLTGWEYYYYRTRNGAEIDLILDGDFGVLPIEIKYGLKTDKNQITSLRKFIKDNNLPFGIVINNSEEVTMLAEGIIQIPAGLV